jgi:hypothetical protein
LVTRIRQDLGDRQRAARLEHQVRAAERRLAIGDLAEDIGQIDQVEAL